MSNRIIVGWTWKQALVFVLFYVIMFGPIAYALWRNS